MSEIMVSPLRVLVTGGGGYIGSALVPALLACGHEVTIIDLMMVDDHYSAPQFPANLIRGDIRDRALMHEHVKEKDVIIHLAFVSNDPGYVLDPLLGESINRDGFTVTLNAAIEANVTRFIFPSSCSVYGRQDSISINEKSVVSPLTPYACFKVECEQLLANIQPNLIEPVIVRAATVCGLSPRLRLDLMVNRMTAEAYYNGTVRISDPSRIRPFIHIRDLVKLYTDLVSFSSELITHQTFNAAFENLSVQETASLVCELTGANLEISAKSTSDSRSYNVNSSKLEHLGFFPKHSITDAVEELMQIFRNDYLPGKWTDERYHNALAQRRLPVWS